MPVEFSPSNWSLSQIGEIFHPNNNICSLYENEETDIINKLSKYIASFNPSETLNYSVETLKSCVEHIETAAQTSKKIVESIGESQIMSDAYSMITFTNLSYLVAASSGVALVLLLNQAMKSRIPEPKVPITLTEEIYYENEPLPNSIELKSFGLFNNLLRIDVDDPNWNPEDKPEDEFEIISNKKIKVMGQEYKIQADHPFLINGAPYIIKKDNSNPNTLSINKYYKVYNHTVIPEHKFLKIELTDENWHPPINYCYFGAVDKETVQIENHLYQVKRNEPFFINNQPYLISHQKGPQGSKFFVKKYIGIDTHPNFGKKDFTRIKLDNPNLIPPTDSEFKIIDHNMIEIKGKKYKVTPDKPFFINNIPYIIKTNLVSPYVIQLDGQPDPAKHADIPMFSIEKYTDDVFSHVQGNTYEKYGDKQQIRFAEIDGKLKYSQILESLTYASAKPTYEWKKVREIGQIKLSEKMAKNIKVLGDSMIKISGEIRSISRDTIFEIGKSKTSKETKNYVLRINQDKTYEFKALSTLE